MPMEKKKETYNVQPTCKKTNIQRCEEKGLGRTLEKLRRRWLSFYTASFFLDRYNSFCAESFLPKTTTELCFSSADFLPHSTYRKKGSRNRALIREFLSYTVGGAASMADGDESDDVSDVNPDELAKMMEVRIKIVFFCSVTNTA